MDSLTGGQPAKKLKRAHSRAVAPLNLNLIKENLFSEYRKDKKKANANSNSKWMSDGSQSINVTASNGSLISRI